MRVAGEDRVAAVEDAARLRDALGVSLPKGLPGAFTGETDAPLDGLVARYARTHGPFVAGDVAARLGTTAERIRAALEALEAAGRVTHGEFRPRGVEREWCDVDVLRRIRQRSLAALRREVEPVDAATLGRFLPAWQGADRPGGGVDALTEAVTRLQGVAIPASILETDVLPSRVRGYRPPDLDALCAGGELVWVGAGALGADDGRVTLCFRDQARLLLSGAAREEPPGGDAARRHPRPPGRARRLLLAGPGPGLGRRRRAAPAGRAVGPGVGRRDHERHARPAPGVRARRLREGARAPARPASAPGRDPPRRPPGRRRPLVLGRPAARAATHPHGGRARARPPAAGPPRHRHPRVRPGRERARRVRRRLPGPQGDGGERQGAARVLRGGTGGGAVRAARRRRSDPRAARGRRRADRRSGGGGRAGGRGPGRGRPRPALRRGPPVAGGRRAVRPGRPAPT